MQPPLAAVSSPRGENYHRTHLNPLVFSAGYRNHSRNFKQKGIYLKELDDFQSLLRAEAAGSKLGPQEWLPEQNRTDERGEWSHPSCAGRTEFEGATGLLQRNAGRSRCHMVRDTRRCYRQGSCLGDTTSQRETAQRGKETVSA